MSNEVFPVLPGIAWNVVRQPEFHTKIQKAVSGRELRLALMSSPMYTFKMSFEVLRQQGVYDEMRTLAAFFMRRLGSFDSFLYTDPTDYQATAAAFGVGAGTTTEFQLARPYGPAGNTFYEYIQNVNGTPTIYIDGTPTTAFTLNSTGLVTFDAPPVDGAALTWTGQFYYRVRFNQDVSEFNQFMQDLFELKKCELYGSLWNKV